MPDRPNDQSTTALPGASPLTAATPLTALVTSFDPREHPGRIIERVMAAAREHLGLEVSFVSEFAGGQRIFRYAGGDLQRFEVEIEGAEPLEQTYCDRVVAGTMGPVVRDAANDPIAASFAVTQEAGVGAYIGVPVRFTDGRLFGTLCCLSGMTAPELSERDIVFMRMAAALVAEQLERADLESGERGALTARVRDALDGGGLEMLFQPIVELETSAVLGYEALSRFPSPPVRGPQEWFEDAWLVGLGTELELAAAALALEQLDLLPAGAYLAINFSPETLLSPGLDEVLGAAPCDRLVIEITEHARVLSYAPVRDRLDELRARGMRVAIDDMGTGYAGITHLLEFRPDMMKVDLSIVRGVRHDRARRAIIATLATLGASIGIDLIAEGVESAEDREALEILGLTVGQGFHLAEPAPLGR